MWSQRVSPCSMGEILTVLPLLLTQVKMLYRLVSCIPVSAEEELIPPTCLSSMNSTISSATSPIPQQHMFIPPHASTVPPSEATPQVFLPHAKTPGPSTSRDKAKVKTVNFTEETHGKSVVSTGKIPKPSGEVGRKGRGGYNLDEKLNWDEEDLAKFKAFIQHQIDKYLNTMQSRTAQDINAMNKTCKNFAILENYENNWPAMDIIHLHLKYLSRKHKENVKVKVSTPEQKGKTWA
ncbi:hypothetical protein V8B97DRAFT_1919327 [Scleroderma yunnanense]